MDSTYFEHIVQAEAREAERRLLFTALRSRSATIKPRNLLAALFWLLGVTR